jgi:hypothetical protein
MTPFAFNYAIQQYQSIFGSEKLSQDLINVLYGNYTNIGFLTKFQSENKTLLAELLNVFADPQLDKSTQQNFGLAMKEFMLSGTFTANSNNYSAYFITFFDPIFGNCIKFNSGFMQNGSTIPTLRQPKSGASYGLQAIHFIDVYSNQSYNFINLINTNTLGLKVSIDDQEAIPMYKDNMIHVMPGTCTYIGLRKTKSTNLPKPYSGCIDFANFKSEVYDKFVMWNKSYTQRACVEVCKQMAVVRACNCSVLNYPNLEGVRACGVGYYERCLQVGQNQRINKCMDLCPLECDVTEYAYSTSMEYFPERVFFDEMKANPVVKSLFARANVAIENVTNDEMAKSTACLNVYFEDMRTTRIRESEAMGVVLLICGSTGNPNKKVGNPKH